MLKLMRFWWISGRSSILSPLRSMKMLLLNTLANVLLKLHVDYINGAFFKTKSSLKYPFNKMDNIF